MHTQQICAGLLRAHTVLQTAHAVQVPAGTLRGIRIGCERHPDFRTVRKNRLPWEYANHSVRLVIQLQDPA